MEHIRSGTKLSPPEVFEDDQKKLWTRGICHQVRAAGAARRSCSSVEKLELRFDTVAFHRKSDSFGWLINDSCLLINESLRFAPNGKHPGPENRHLRTSSLPCSIERAMAFPALKGKTRCVCVCVTLRLQEFVPRNAGACDTLNLSHATKLWIRVGRETWPVSCTCDLNC